jgi:hypothetical protein
MNRRSPAGAASRAVRALGACALAIIVFGVALGACGSSPSPTSSAASSDEAAAPSDSPVGTFWPEEVPPAIVALGAGDNEIRKAGVDMGAAVAQEDLHGMAGAAGGLANLTTGLIPDAQAVARYGPFSDLGSRAVTALTHLHDGAVALSDAIRAGNADKILSASTAIGQALEEYGAVRPGLSDLVPEALRQQRALLK